MGSQFFAYHRTVIFFSFLAVILIVTIPVYLLLGSKGVPERQEKEDKGLSVVDKEGALRVSVAGMLSPRETFGQYAKILKYLSQKLDKPVILVQRRRYQEVNDLIREGKVDLAFLCSGGYVDLSRDNLVELLAVPSVKGKTEYYSYIIARETSNLHTFEDLRGRRFAFTDPLSATGKLYPTYLVKKMNLKLEEYFSKYIYTHTHDNSIRAVQRGIVDGAAVDSLIFDYLATKKSDRVRGIKIIEKSPPFGVPPIVVRVDMDSGLKKRMRKILFKMHEDEEGQEILSQLLIDKFVVGNDHSYDSLREMRSFVSGQ